MSFFSNLITLFLLILARQRNCLGTKIKGTFRGTAQKMKFSTKDFFSKCDQILRKLRVWSHLLKKPLMENFIFCTVWVRIFVTKLLFCLFDNNLESLGLNLRLFKLFHDGGRYHIETSPLICSVKSMDWFLLDNGFRHERVT